LKDNRCGIRRWLSGHLFFKKFLYQVSYASSNKKALEKS